MGSAPLGHQAEVVGGWNRWSVVSGVVLLACGGTVGRNQTDDRNGADTAGRGGAAGVSHQGGVPFSPSGGSAPSGSPSVAAGEGGTGGEDSQAGASGEAGAPLEPPPCVTLGPPWEPLDACVPDASGQCPAGFTAFEEANTAIPVCTKREAGCGLTPSVLTWAHQRAQQLEALEAPVQRWVDVNAWPFCQEQTPLVPGDELTGTTHVDDKASTFHAQLSPESTLHVAAADAALRFQVFDERCVPLFTSELLSPGSSFSPALEAGRYVFLVLSNAPNNHFTLTSSGGAPGPVELLSPIWELRRLGYDTCEEAGDHRSSLCVNGWGASNILFGPPSDPPGYECTDAAFYEVPACPTPDSLYLIFSEARVVGSHFPDGLSQVVVSQLEETPSCPTCDSSAVLLRPSVTNGVAFVDVSAGQNRYGTAQLSSLGGYRLTGVPLHSLPTAALASRTSWRTCAP